MFSVIVWVWLGMPLAAPFGVTCKGIPGGEKADGACKPRARVRWGLGGDRRACWVSGVAGPMPICPS